MIAVLAMPVITYSYETLNACHTLLRSLGDVRTGANESCGMWSNYRPVRRADLTMEFIYGATNGSKNV